MRRLRETDTLIFVMLLSVLMTGGCAAIPDSVNYTWSRSRVTGEQTDYFGASWDIPDSWKHPQK